MRPVPCRPRTSAKASSRTPRKSPARPWPPTSKTRGKTKHGCHTGCIIQCSQVYNDANGKFLTTGFEYETVWGFGANLLIDNLDDIAMMDRTCDEVGMDTIELANTMAMAMEGGVIAWGDSRRPSSPN